MSVRKLPAPGSVASRQMHENAQRILDFGAEILNKFDFKMADNIVMDTGYAVSTGFRLFFSIFTTGKRREFMYLCI